MRFVFGCMVSFYLLELLHVDIRHLFYTKAVCIRCYHKIGMQEL